MSEKHISKLPLDSNDQRENALWDLLESVPQDEPSAKLRQGFYRKLEQATKPGLVTRLREFLGFSGNAGWVTAAVCLIAGVATGQLLEETADDASGHLAALEQNVNLLNRTLVLDRLNNEEPGKRLRGVMDAAYLAGDDADIARQLLTVATSDRVNSIRSAAVESLGSNINSPAIGEQLMDTLQRAESPLVQLALIDLVLRNGSNQQLDRLLTLANNGQLYPDLQRHVLTSLGRDMT